MVMRKSLYAAIFLSFLFAVFLAVPNAYAASQISVGVKNADFSSSTLEVGKSYYATVESTNSGSIMYKVDYVIKYYKNGDWEEETRGTCENGGFNTTLKTPKKFTIEKGVSKVKVIWTIQSNPNITANPRVAEETENVKASKPKVSLDDAEFSKDTLEVGEYYTASVVSKNSGDVDYKVKYEIEYYKDGKWKELDDGTLENPSTSKKTLTTPKFKVPESARMKVRWTIEENDDIDIDNGSKTAYADVKGSDSKKLDEIEVNPTSVTIYGFNNSDKKLKVTAKYTDNSTKDVTKYATYTSGDEKIVKVNDGVLTSGSKEGSTYISIKYKDGNVTEQETCKVTVKKSSEVKTLKDISISPDNVTITGFNKSGGNIKVTAYYSDQSTDDVTKKADYKGSNDIVKVSSSDALTSANKAGTAYIAVSYKEGDISVQKTCTVTVVEAVKTAVSMTGAGFEQAVITPGSKARAYVDTTNQSTEKFDIDYKIFYSTDGMNFTKTVTSGSVEQSGKTTERLMTREFTVKDTYKKLKVVFTISDKEPVQVTGDNPKESIREVILPTVSLPGAGFNTIQENNKIMFKAYVDTTNSSTGEYDIDYEIYYSTDGVSFTKKISRGTLKQSGKSTERLETRAYKIDENYKKLKAIFTIPDDQPVVAVGEKRMEAIMNVNSAGDGFSDLPPGHWAYDAVMGLVNRGVLAGYPDGTFKPEKEVTREEFAKIMTLALQLPLVNPKEPAFIDVGSKHWSYKYVETAKSYLTGYRTSSGLKFKGSENALREDIAVALVKAKDYQNDIVDINQLSSIFTDSNAISENLKKYVLIAKKRGLIDGYPDGTFRPQTTLTRAESAKLLWQVVSNGDEKVVIQ